MTILTLRELEDRFADFYDARLASKRSEADRDRLQAIDRDLVQWFADHGIELVVDRDPVTQEQRQAHMPVLAPHGEADEHPNTRYTLEVVVGYVDCSILLTQEYGSRAQVDRGYLATAIKGIRHVQVVRHSPDSSQIIQSLTPGEAR